jgi:hypothetical protein
MLKFVLPTLCGVLCVSNLFGATIGSSHEPSPFPQNVDPYFDTIFSPDIGDTVGNTSTTIPHVTVDASGDFAGIGEVDYYSFTVTAPGRGIFDIDYASIGGLDTYIELFPFGNPIGFANNDDSSPTFGAGGSSGVLAFHDSYLEYLFSSPGVYVIGVGASGNGLEPIPNGQPYILQISVPHTQEAPSVPDSGSTLLLLGGGLLALFAVGRRSLVKA